MTAKELTSRDYDRLLDLVAELATIRDPAEFADVVPSLVPTVVDSDVTSLNDVDPAAQIVRAVVKPDTFRMPPEAVAAFTELAGQHPLITHMGTTGDGSAIKISDFWSGEQWHESELFARVYQPMGVEHQMAISLPAPQPIVIGLAVNRADIDHDFSERDRTVLDRLRPHLAESWRNAREHSKVRSLLAAATRALGAADTAVLLLSDPIEELTPGALTELYRFFGRPGARTPLPLRVVGWLDRERGLSAPLRIARPLVATRDGRQLVANYLPGVDDGVDALVLRTSSQRELPGRLVRLGLSGREAEVLELLTTGATNAEVADTLRLAPATVKRHIENIYRKLGVSGRVQASAIALSIAGTD